MSSNKLVNLPVRAGTAVQLTTAELARPAGYEQRSADDSDRRLVLQEALTL